MKKYRYPGALPFSTKQSDIFFGRRKDIEQFYQFIALDKLTVLCSRSGLGKSSLLNAGIIPKIQKESPLEPLIVKGFGLYTAGQGETPLSITHDVMRLGETPSATLDKLAPEENSCWSLAKARQLNSGLKKNGLILILDQFEEFFSYPRDSQVAFQRELAELLYTSLPQRILDKIQPHMKGESTVLSAEEIKALHHPFRAKVVLSIRSDRLHLLNEMAAFLPRVMAHCYELGPLHAEEAREAIVLPARSTAPGFISPPFEFEEEAVDKIMTFLTRNGTQSVESFQVQYLCETIERKVMESGLKQVRAEDIGDIEKIYENYYDNQIARITPMEDRETARHLIEEGLIFEEEELRLTLFEGQAQQAYGATPELLSQLVDLRLLKSGHSSRGGFTYELSHDTLVQPVLKAKRQREAEEREKEQELQRLERELELEEERFRRRRALRAVVLSLLLAIAAVLAAIWAVNERHRAEEASRRSRVNELANANAISALEAAQENPNTGLLIANYLYGRYPKEPTAALAFHYILSDTSLEYSLKTKEIAKDSFVAGASVKGNLILTFEGTGLLKASALSPDGKYLALGFMDSIHLWNLEKKQPLARMRHCGVEDIAFVPGSERLLSASRDTIRQWDLQGRALDEGTRLIIRVAEQTDGQDYAFDPANQVICFSPGGDKVIKAGYKGRIAGIWTGLLNSTTPIRERSLTGQSGTVTSAAFSPDGTYIILGFQESKAVLFDDKFFPKATFELPGQGVSAIGISGDNRYVLTGSTDGSVKAWRVESGRAEKTFLGHDWPVSAVAFSPDGKYILTGCNIEAMVKLWDFENEKVLQTFKNKQPNRNALDFSPDGRFFFIGSWYEPALFQTPRSFIEERIAPVPFREMLLNGLQLSPEGLQAYSDTAAQEDLKAVADHYYRQRNWQHAELLYQKLDQHTPGPEYLFRYMVAREQQNKRVKVRPRQLLDTSNLTLLKDAFQFYFRKEDWKNASLFAEQIWAQEDIAGHRYQVYLADKKRGADRFDELFMVEDTAKLREYWIYWTTLDPGVDYKDFVINFPKGMAIAERLISLSPPEKAKALRKEAANNYNSLGWTQLLTGNFEGCEASIRRGMELDPKNKYLYTNLPPALLLQGKFDEAKEEYSRLAGEEYMPERGYEHYRDIFLKDLAVLDSSDVIPAGQRSNQVEEIIALLKE